MVLKKVFKIVVLFIAVLPFCQSAVSQQDMTKDAADVDAYFDGQKDAFAFPPAYRGGDISWDRSGTTITFRVNAAFRMSDMGTVFPGALVDVGSDFNFGDGSPLEDVRFLVQMTSPSTDVVYGRLVRSSGAALTHIYPSTGTFEAFWEGPNRLPTANNFSTDNWRAEVTVRMQADITKSPINNQSAVIIAADNNLLFYTIPIQSFDNSIYSVSVGTAADFIATPSNPGSHILPAGMTINSNGLVAWDLTDSVRPGVTPGQIYYVAVKITDSNGVVVPFEFMVQVEPDYNIAPVNVVPPAQYSYRNGSISFGSYNQISVYDPDGQGGNLTTTISVQNGTLTLGTTAGLTFTVGDGTADATMTMTGPQTALANAFWGMTYHPTINYSGPDSFTIVTNDNGNTGGLPLTDTDSFAISVLTVTHANVSLAGRVSAADGRGIAGALVQLTLQSGETRSARTSSFGYYAFRNIRAGEGVIVTVAAKRYEFSEPTRFILMSADIANVDFVANPQMN